MSKFMVDCEQKSIYEALGEDDKRLKEYADAIEEAVRKGESNYGYTLKTIGDRFDIPKSIWHLIREDLSVTDEEMFGPEDSLYRDRIEKLRWIEKN